MNLSKLVSVAETEKDTAALHQEAAIILFTEYCDNSHEMY